jgi:hypothetical protein
MIVLFFGLLIFRQKDELIAAVMLEKVSKYEMLRRQEMKRVFNWFDKNTAPDSSVLTYSYDYGVYLPMYTHNNVYHNGYNAHSLVSDDELEDRWLIQNIFNKKFGKKYVADFHREFQGNRFIDRYQNDLVRQKLLNVIAGRNVRAKELVPEEYLNKVLAKYEQFQKEDYEVLVKKYPVDYILVDSTDQNNGNLVGKLSSYKTFEIATNIGNIYIFKIN